MPEDVVTLSTFGMQEKWNYNREAVEQFINGQIDNIKAMKLSFDAAARDVGRAPPKIVLSALMIPQWKRGEHYTNENYDSPNYRKAQAEYFEYLREQCDAAGIVVEDFYNHAATNDEKVYLERLEALGSTADLIKNRAIIKNQGNRHLQIDTNTIVVDRKAFYKATIGAEIQKDGMNASYYDDSGAYVSPHNKVVYTCEESEFAKSLEKQHDGYVVESKERLDRKTPSSNQIYSVCYSKACLECGLVTYDRKYYSQWNNLWGCYSVNLAHPTFEMTKHIITAINMSWSQGDGKVDYCAALKSIKVPVTVNNETTTLDFQSFSYLIKKYTNPNLGAEDRTKLIAISDAVYDDLAIKKFVEHVIKTNDISLLAPLLSTIPDTDSGKQILKELFDTCKNDEHFKSMIKNTIINDKVTPENLKVLAKFIPDDSDFQDEKKAIIKLSDELLSTRNTELNSSVDSMKREIYKAVKLKLDTLGSPYTVSKEDKSTIFQDIDSILSKDCLNNLTIEEFKQTAISMAANKLLNNKLKQQPTVITALTGQEEFVQHTIMSKIYIPPINEKFNRAEIDNMVNRIAGDVGFTKAMHIRKAFFQSEEVQFYIDFLNKSAAIRPIDPKTEVVIEKMADALMTAVRDLSNKSEVPDNINGYLNEHLDKVQEKYQTPVNSSVSASSSSEPPRRDLKNRLKILTEKAVAEDVVTSAALSASQHN